ncbi:MAG: adenylate/guanylate cyclase domain-containing protein, partial [Thermodesulfobacteriota bacterium]
WGGDIDPYWMVWNLGVGGLLVAVCVLLLGFVIQRWREHEIRVTELSDLLKKMFGRYLSTEVMNSLLENPAALELGGEKRSVTIMMTDLRGFTALSEGLAPEQVVQMLNAYFEVMVEVILEYHGTINQIIGDALLVVFGAPQEMTDRAQRAVACAIAMQNAMAEVNERNREEGLPELEMGIGLNEAEVIVGNIGSSKRSNYSVVGSGVNLASRIESYTVGGQILISESVRRQAGEALRIDDRMEILPKGADAPLQVFEVGGIGGRYNLVLPDREAGLTALAREIPVRLTVLEGKHVGRGEQKGVLVRLSRKSGELRVGSPLDPLTNLKLNLDVANRNLSEKDFYGKVELRSDLGPGFCRVRFSALPPRIEAYFQAALDLGAVRG